ncbi:MAG: RNA polymerase sigma factor [Gemmatimonadetes bacterium]|nr:RNA polymerase sigma factor [Gemmatimonadota bacterium]
MFDLEKYHSGDHGYFESLVRLHGPMVLQICMAYSDSRDHAEDLFQKTWIRAFEKRRAYRGNGSFKAWLRRLATNVCISAFRSDRTRQAFRATWDGTRLGEELSWGSPDPQAEVEDQERHGAVMRALGALPRRAREAITLRILDDKSAGEVARIMGTKESTVRSNIRHGIKQLKKILGES